MASLSKEQIEKLKGSSEPALFRHACTMYDAMLKEATQETVDDETFWVYRGYLGKAYEAANLSNQYYSAVMDLLNKHGCIEILARGVVNTPACVVLLTHPNDADVPQDAKRYVKQIRRRPLTPAADHAKLAQRVDNLAKALGGVNLIEVVTSLDKLDRRLTELERVTKAVSEGETNAKNTQSTA